jgi:hypothetical protein
MTVQECKNCKGRFKAMMMFLVFRGDSGNLCLDDREDAREYTVYNKVLERCYTMLYTNSDGV